MVDNNNKSGFQSSTGFDSEAEFEKTKETIDKKLDISVGVAKAGNDASVAKAELIMTTNNADSLTNAKKKETIETLERLYTKGESGRQNAKDIMHAHSKDAGANISEDDAKELANNKRLQEPAKGKITEKLQSEAIANQTNPNNSNISR